jgi:large conductance mechanosensitive channel
MTLAQEFKAFALKGNVVDLAVAVIIGGAFGKIVSALVEDIFMPMVGAVMPGGDWRTFAVTSLNLKLGHLLGTVIDFLVVALVLFITVVKLMGSLQKKEDAPAAPASKTCPECLDTIPFAAKRCRSCAQSQPGAA